MKLTIAIPTYNRCSYLVQTLDSIIVQKTDGIEIVVSDNCSTDGTELVMSDYCTKYPFIKYYRNSENLKFDGNCLNCLRKSTGEYVHLMADDDILLSGAVKKIIDLIDKEKPSYINLNSSTFIKSVEEIDFNNPRIKFPENKDLITNDKEKYTELIGVFFTYISATVIRKDDFLNVLNPEQYLGTAFIHTHILFDILKGNGKVIITKDPLIGARMGNSGGFNLYEVWVHQYKKLLLDTAVKNGFSKKTMESIYKKDINGFIRDSIKCYRLDKSKPYDMRCNHILYENTKEYFSVWIKTFPIAFAPSFIIKILNRIEWRMKKIFHNKGD